MNLPSVIDPDSMAAGLKKHHCPRRSGVRKVAEVPKVRDHGTVLIDMSVTRHVLIVISTLQHAAQEHLVQLWSRVLQLT